MYHYTIILFSLLPLPQTLPLSKPGANKADFNQIRNSYFFSSRLWILLDYNVQYKLSVQCRTKEELGQNIHESTRFFVDRYLEEFNSHN